MTANKEVPKDGTEAFYEGFELEDNPFPEFIEEFEEWDRDFLEVHKHYKEEGRFNDGSFKG